MILPISRLRALLKIHVDNCQSHLNTKKDSLGKAQNVEWLFI